jgi:hypothetical protein
MKRQGIRELGILSVVTGVAALVLGTAPVRSAQAATEPFTQAQVFFEYNSVEGNMGIQLFFDGEWTEVEIRDPKGRVIFETDAQRRLRKVGGAEVRFESVEPSFDPADPDPDFFKKFPAGSYTFRGNALDGGKLKSTVELSHQLPAAPLVTPSSNKVQWTWAQGPPPLDAAPLAGFQVIFEILVNDSVVRSLTVELPASATSFVIPGEFLPTPAEVSAGAVLVFEVLALAENGNRTITQGNIP